MPKLAAQSSKISIEIPSPAELSEEALRLLKEQVCFVDERIVSVSLAAGRLEIQCSEPLSNPESLKENLDRLVQRTSRSFKKSVFQVLAEGEGEILNHSDPFPLLAARREVVKVGPGVYVYQGEFLKKLEALDRIFREAALEKGAIEQGVPTTVSAQSLVQNGYVGGFPHQLFLVGSIHHDLELIEGLAADSRKYLTSSGALEGVASHHTQLLSPTVCYHSFESLRGQTLPNVTALFTAVGKCHRNEGTGVEGLHRLQTFTMREVISFGSKDFVESERASNLDHLKRLFGNWKMKYRVVTASDAFFSGGSERRRAYQSTFQLKYEMQLYLPHRKDWLAVASFNSHQDTLVNAYQIKSRSGEPLFSGCTGYGYERLAYAIYAQKGIRSPAGPET